MCVNTATPPGPYTISQTWHILTRGPKASLSQVGGESELRGIFFQTLPELVTPLKPLHLNAAVQRRGQRTPKGLGNCKSVEATYRPSFYVKMTRIRPGLKNTRLQVILVLFVLAYHRGQL